jgi:hypothetical protein
VGLLHVHGHAPPLGVHRRPPGWRHRLARGGGPYPSGLQSLHRPPRHLRPPPATRLATPRLAASRLAGASGLAGQSRVLTVPVALAVARCR